MATSKNGSFQICSIDFVLAKDSMTSSCDITRTISIGKPLNIVACIGGI